MKLDEFLTYVYEGREFELTFDSVPYFLYYDLENIDGKEVQIMHLSDCKLKKEIFKGTVEELLDFDFGNNTTLRLNINRICFDCVL